VISNPTVERSSAQGQQAFSVEQSRQEVRAADAQHRRDEAQKDNELRRQLIRYFSVMALLVVGSAFVFGIVLGVVVDDNDIQNAGISLVGTIVGAVIGAIAGYFAGKSK